jgi:hypothetical protein
MISKENKYNFENNKTSASDDQFWAQLLLSILMFGVKLMDGSTLIFLFNNVISRKDAFVKIWIRHQRFQNQYSRVHLLENTYFLII